MSKLFRFFLFLTIFWGCTVTCRSQSGKDSIPGFHDDLLDKLVGNWNVTSVAHGFSSTAKLEARWVMSHQHLFIHFTGNEIIPWFRAPVEFEYFIGFKHSTQNYVVHSVSIFGDDDYEGFCYAVRHGNELDLMQKNPCATDKVIVQRFSWDAAHGTWTIKSWDVEGDKAGEVFLDMKLDKAKNN